MGNCCFDDGGVESELGENRRGVWIGISDINGGSKQTSRFKPLEVQRVAGVSAELLPILSSGACLWEHGYILNTVIFRGRAGSYSPCLREMMHREAGVFFRPDVYVKRPVQRNRRLCVFFR